MRRSVWLGLVTLSLACEGRDAKLERRVLENIAREVPAATVDVSVEEGVARLSGLAATERERGWIEGAARGVQGVRWVDNEIEVAEPEVPSGEYLPRVVVVEQEIQQRLAEAGYPEVRVNIQEPGTATLTGAVDRAARDEVIRIALEASPLVERVEEHLMFR